MAACGHSQDHSKARKYQLTHPYPIAPLLPRTQSMPRNGRAGCSLIKFLVAPKTGNAFSASVRTIVVGRLARRRFSSQHILYSRANPSSQCLYLEQFPSLDAPPRMTPAAEPAKRSADALCTDDEPPNTVSLNAHQIVVTTHGDNGSHPGQVRASGGALLTNPNRSGMFQKSISYVTHKHWQALATARTRQ
jgi:hypothetical protein